jgi:O-acetylhomoserine (thiol)-lyase
VANAGVHQLVVDNTSATPYLAGHRARRDIVGQLDHQVPDGNGTVTGGCMVDSGKFDWRALPASFPSDRARAAYHGLRFHGPSAHGLTFHGIAVGLRDLGMDHEPAGRALHAPGIETLSCAWTGTSRTPWPWRAGSRRPARGP